MKKIAYMIRIYARYPYKENQTVTSIIWSAGVGRIEAYSENTIFFHFAYTEKTSIPFPFKLNGI